MDVDTLKKIQDIGNILLIKCYLLTYYSSLYFIITRTESVTRISVWFKTSCARASRPPKNKKRFAMISLISPYSPRAPHQVKSNWRFCTRPLVTSPLGNPFMSYLLQDHLSHQHSYLPTTTFPQSTTATIFGSQSQRYSFAPPLASFPYQRKRGTGWR